MSEITDKLRADAAWAGARTATTVRQIGRDCAEAADYIDRLEATLEPFAGDKLPALRRTEIGYDRNGLRRLISPMELACVAARRALTPVAETPNQEPAP